MTPEPQTESSNTPEDAPGSKPEPKGPEQAAVDQSPENVPAPVGSDVRHVGERQGMFGVRGTGDTSGYGGLRQAVAFPGSSQRPYGGWFDDVADALEQALAGGGVEHA